MESQEERSRRAADNLRGILLTLATAGIGAAYTLRDDTDRSYWIGAACCFIAALAAILRSWFLVKARALDRLADTPESRARLPGKDKWHPRASWLWDTAAAWALVAGATVLAIGLA